MPDDEDVTLDKQRAEREEVERHGESPEGAPADPHRALNQPASVPAADEWPDPYERRPDPRAPYEAGEEPPAPASGAVSTSEPHPREDPEAVPAQPPERDKLDQ
jgi:hypothetical protein